MSGAAAPPAGISHVPAPWTTESECWLLTVFLGGKLPEGVYDPLEASSSAFANSKEAGKFEGGLGMIMIVRYKETPVGPYDELILIPGNYEVPGKNNSLRRISRIYVSQADTTWNGRWNWNIPKHLARFRFSTPSNSATGTTQLEVFPPQEDATAAFFTCTLAPFQYLPSFPFSTRWVPLSTTLAQPPLPSALQGLAHEEAQKASRELQVLVGTESWKSVPITASTPTARMCWVDVHPLAMESKDEAARWWPVEVKPWKAGVWMRGAKIDIPVPDEWKL